MQPIAFCNRCRGMKVGWNRRYVAHCLVCRKWLAKSIKISVLTGVLSSLVFAFPVTTAVGPSLPDAKTAEVNAARKYAQKVSIVEAMLSRQGLDQERLPRVRDAIMTSSIRHGVDPQLVASIIIVESGANPFAVSDADSVGLMQVHLRTWGPMADKENINLFKIEDNVDFGVRILRDYIAASDTWEGVARYRGKTEDPESQQTALEYVQKVQRVYGISPQSVASVNP